jgi:ankyrin repeat protein
MHPVQTAGTVCQTPLMCACREGKLEAVKILVQRGADINIESEVIYMSNMEKHGKLWLGGIRNIILYRDGRQSGLLRSTDTLLWPSFL